MTDAEQNNIQTVLEILEDEKRGDTRSALTKMHPGYSMTWMYRNSKGLLFPRDYAKSENDLDDVYAIKDRQYDIRNICAKDNVVMIEVVESYPDPETGKTYRTPEVIVLEFKEGKIWKGRHYCDPAISNLGLDRERVDEAYK